MVLIGRTAEALRQLLSIVLRHFSALKLVISVSKSKVLSNNQDLWEVWDEEGEEVSGCLDKVLEFKYLGLESQLSPYQGARVVQKRAIQGARKYRGVCGLLARDGPDMVEVGMSTWVNIARTSFLYGTEYTPFTETTMQELDRIQAAMSKELLGLGRFVLTPL